jgi:hypothetical protein
MRAKVSLTCDALTLKYDTQIAWNVRVSHANNAFASMTVLPLTGTVLYFRDFVSFTRDTFDHLFVVNVIRQFV